MNAQKRMLEHQFIKQNKERNNYVYVAEELKEVDLERKKEEKWK